MATVTPTPPPAGAPAASQLRRCGLGTGFVEAFEHRLRVLVGAVTLVAGLSRWLP